MITLAETKQPVNKFFFFKKQRKGLVIQHLLLAKSRFKTKAQAVAWIKSHGFNPNNYREKKNNHHFTQKDKSLFKPKTFVTVRITNGVQAVMGRLKKKKLISLFELLGG